MKTLSFAEFHSTTNIYGLMTFLEENKLPKKYIVKAVFDTANLFDYSSFKKEDQQFYFKILKLVKMYLNYEITTKEYQILSNESPLPFEEYESYSTKCFNNINYMILRDEIDRMYPFYAAKFFANAAFLIFPFLPSYSLDLVRKTLPWNTICAAQIAMITNQPGDEKLIEQFLENNQLIDYATIILGTENLREEFEFLIKNYLENH